MTARQRSINFGLVAGGALVHGETLLRRWLPDGRREGHEWSARNPKRSDGRLGSFKVNLRTGCWSDFATGDRGGDLVSLAAFLFDLSQKEAALRVADMLGFSPYE